MDEQTNEILESLELILEEDMPSKIRVQIQEVFDNLKKDSSAESLMKAQDDLETISNAANLDDYVRNELINLGPIIESIYNS